MKCFTTIFAACAVLLSIICPVVTPSPTIKVEGRGLSSRFVPAVHPVFPRAYWDNAPSPDRTVKEPVALVKRHYPAGPTASNWVYRSEPYGYSESHRKKEDHWRKDHSGK
ncbi:hypothetical protein ABVK25_006352 [Lepraria finkii]|uniref:Uncharacterized protein n=1 Tax=Lepraria finkii TaxID=1340010 RepID=A0ABR4B7F6_9LECA